MNKLLHVLNIVFFTVGITLFIFGSPVVVRAADTSGWDGIPPFINVGSLDFDAPNSDSYRSCSISGSPYGVFRIFEDGGRNQVFVLFFNIGSVPNVIENNFTSSFSGNYVYTLNNTSYTVYYRCYKNTYVPFSSNINYSGTTISHTLDSSSDCQVVCNYFLFGVGDIGDYLLPEFDIEDADLDIVGLSCYILNDQTGSVDYKETIRNSFYGFTQYIFNNLSGGIFSDSFLPPLLDESPLTGSIVNYVPGIALSWLSPPLDPDITYTVWIDGKSIVNYKTSADPIVNFVSDLKPATSVSYAKLKINESSLSQSGNSFYQYNTNQGFETILNYIENNSSISPPSTPWQRYSYIGLDTKISRVYIQASKVIDGNNHIGALSYVDIIDGIPSVHEGVTSIDDVTASDPDTGTGNNVGVPYTVSGDTIYTGDTINNGDTYNIYGGAGLVVGGGNPLNTVKTLFNAIIRLVEALYLTHLIKWILVGFTGNPLGDFIL